MENAKYQDSIIILEPFFACMEILAMDLDITKRHTT